jgi:hypothetical protein
MRTAPLPAAIALMLAIANPPDAAAICWPREVNDVPAFIRVVGTHGGVPDTIGTYTVVARDFARNPIPGAVVTLDFSSCPDLALCSVAAGGAVLDCATRKVAAVTNAWGTAKIIVLGGGRVDGSSVPPAIAPGAGVGCVLVSIDIGNPGCP